MEMKSTAGDDSPYMASLVNATSLFQKAHTSKLLASLFQAQNQLKTDDFQIRYNPPGQTACSFVEPIVNTAPSQRHMIKQSSGGGARGSSLRGCDRDESSMRGDVWFLVVTLLVVRVVAGAEGTSSSLALGATLSRAESLVSANGVFALGFFSTGGGVYGFGIWYAKLVSLGSLTVVWSRRDLKLGRDAFLKLADDGTLQLFDSAASTPVWTSDNSPVQAKSLKLQDDGNLVLLDSTSTITLWQSFDTPTDTLLPGQSLYKNQSLISWRSADDWSAGYYYCTWLPINGTQTLTLSWNGKSIANWNTSSWSNTSISLNAETIYYPYLIDSPGTANYLLFNGSLYSSQSLIISSITSGPLRRATLARDGGLRIYSWTLGTSTTWSVEANWVTPPCAVFAQCGPYGVCNADPESPAYLATCSCPQGFRFVDSNDELKGCTQEFAFPSGVCNSKLTMRKIGDNDYPFANRLRDAYMNTTEAECLALCLSNCRCDGAIFWRRDGRCYLKSGPLFNGGFPQDVGNHSAYLKVLTGPLDPRSGRSKELGAILGVTLSVTAFVCFGALWWVSWRRRRRRECLLYCDHGAAFGPRRFSLRELSAATKNFSELIGRGGMGTVYKGVYADAVVAVKLIRHESSEAGFLAEATSISQIRHRNLMQMKGWCIENGSFLLVYDYMPNGSLDQWLYTSNIHRRELSWPLRYSILTGIAAALAYLHEDWQQCVLHRDIKSSNVLLDADFNSYLGDFGLARLIDHEKVEKTTLMAGTLAYMAPEMPYTGRATKETDVYSFGVLVLEVVCGAKPVDSKLEESEDEPVLLHRVWRAKEAGDLLSALDPRLRMRLSKDSASSRDPALNRRIAEEMARESDEQMHALQLGLLCCLPNPNARPSMRLVHHILCGDVTSIPPLPDFYQLSSQLDFLHSHPTITTSSAADASHKILAIPPLFADIFECDQSSPLVTEDFKSG